MKIKASKYKGVSKASSNGSKKYWQALCNTSAGRICCKRCDTEREAAIAYDKMMIEQGKEPVNILVRK